MGATGASGEGDRPATAVYHEQQVMSMCGVHCLNTLLQANAFTEVDLAQIAHELDRREREVREPASHPHERASNRLPPRSFREEKMSLRDVTQQTNERMKRSNAS